MRGQSEVQYELVAVSLEQAVPAAHPLRAIKALLGSVLRELDAEFAACYGRTGRPSIPPEALVAAEVLMALYGVRSERQFCEQLGYDLRFRWFVDWPLSQPAWDPSTFSKNRARLLNAPFAQRLLAAVVERAHAAGLLADGQFAVDGTIHRAWASNGSFRETGEAPVRGKNGRRRVNATRQSTTDPEARLTHRGPGFLGVALVATTALLCVDYAIVSPSGRAEWETAPQLLARQGLTHGTLVADRGFDQAPFHAALAAQGLTDHVAYNRHVHPDESPPAVVGSPPYAASQIARRKIEGLFGWLKRGRLHHLRFRGCAKNEAFALTCVTTYNLLRLTKLGIT